MNDCQNVTMREALPELLHGQLPHEERRLVEAHLTDCVDCAEELAILEAVLASAPAPTVNVTRIVASIPAYHPATAAAPHAEAHVEAHVEARVSAAPRAQGVVPLRPRSSWSARASRLQLAAALAIAAAGISTVAVVAHEHQSPQMAAVASSGASAPAQGVALVSTADLSDAQLAALINDMSSIQALPPADPEPISPVVDGGV